MKLSVIMPVNKLDDFLRQSLLSINSQTFKDFELLLICNKNIENSLDSFIKSLNLDLKYKIISTILDGVAFSANLGIENSTGDYIARWDSDDLCDPNRFSCQINELDKDKNLHVIGTIVELIDENNNTIKIQKFKFFGDNFSIRKALKYRQSLLHSSLMFRTEILFINNGYLYGHTSEDHELFIRIARDKNINFVCNCGEECTKIFRNIYEDSGMYCKKCMKRNTIKKRENTNIKKYNVKSVSQLKEIQDKIKATSLSHFGTERPTQSKQIQEKVKQTNLERRGKEYPTQCPEVMEKVIETNLEKRGVKHSLQSEEVKKKGKEIPEFNTIPNKEPAQTIGISGFFSAKYFNVFNASGHSCISSKIISVLASMVLPLINESELIIRSTSLLAVKKSFSSGRSSKLK
jgi:glycosyltransferase involved in cell wall biosynthesis